MNEAIIGSGNVALPVSLQWRHGERDGVSNHRRLDCLLSRLFSRRSKKISKLRVTGICEGNPPVTGGFPHKGPVTRKMFPFDDVVMWCQEIAISMKMTTSAPDALGGTNQWHIYRDCEVEMVHLKWFVHQNSAKIYKNTTKHISQTSSD